jgi:hypothetical protein
MKKTIQTCTFLLALTFALAAIHINAQTMTGTVLTQPCNNNGQIGVTVTGLTPPISYTYNNWAANVNIVHTGVTTLTDVVGGLNAYQYLNYANPNSWGIAASDGTNTAYFSITLTPAFSDTIKVYNGLCPAPSTLQAIAFNGGTPPYSVVWTNTATSTSYSANPALVSNGSYQFLITDGAGCTVRSANGFTFNAQVTSLSNINFIVTGTSANCTNGTAIVGPVSGGVAPYTYLWNNSANTTSLSGLTQGLYNCTVTDAIGCQKTNNYYVSQAVTINYNSSVTNATCLQNNGSVLSFVSGGTTPYSFAWSNGANTQNLTAVTGGSSYIVQITDANACTGTGYVYVGVSTPIFVTYTASPSSCTTPNGSATITPVGGAVPYSIIWYTFPLNSTGTSISNYGPGNYSFKVTDANGCIQTGSAIIPPTSTITAFITNGSIVCPATTGNISVTASSTSGPLTYLWNNAATTSAITAPLGNYNCVITDAGGCSVTKYGSINQISPVSVGFSTTPATCIYFSNGSAMANASGGTAPYAYLWSNSQTGTTASALMPGHYYVTATDANGCQGWGHTYVGSNGTNNSCYCTITGTVYADANNNCVRNTGENGIPNIQVHCSGFGYSYTNASGVYSFLVPTGTYAISESVQALYPLSTCQSNAQVVSVVAVSNCSTVVNFANNILVLPTFHDLHIITSNINSPVPGNSYTQRVIVQNEGSFVESTVKLGYKHDGQLNYSSSSPWTLIQQNPLNHPNWFSINTGFPALNANTNSSTLINYNVPTNIPVNTAVNFMDSCSSAAPIATNWLTDYTPWNNVNSHQAVVVASYDPNFKEVSPQGVGPNGNIQSKDSLLTYIVHFQNEGTYYAQNVVVVDTLDPDLKITSLRPGYSDHKYSVSLSDNGVATFTFKNINLPWKSAFGDALSSGMFVYSIKTKKNLPLGTQIKNKAAIYFDYNAPIITNTTLNTLVAGGPTTSVMDLSNNKNDKLLLFPNPASGDFIVLYESAENSNALLNIIDISGREVSSKNINLSIGENNFTENTSHLQNGIYLVQLKTTSQTITKKLVIAK